MQILLHDYGNYPFTRQLARELAARGHAMDYVYSESTQLIKRGTANPSTKNLTVTGILLDKPFQKYNYLQRRRCEIEHGRKLAAIVERIRPDVVLSANTPLDAQELALRASRKVGAKFVFWMQDAIGLATNQTLARKIPFLGSMVGDFYIQREKEMLQRSDHVVLISEDFLPLMRSWQVDETHCTVIPNWAPLDEINVQSKHNAWAKAHALDGKFCVIYTGILGLKHNPALFIQLAEAFKENTDVRIVVVSAGDAIDWLTREAKDRNLDNLVLLPPQPEDTYAQVLGTANVLLSILSESAGSYSVPSKVLSYLCAGRPLLLAVPEANLSTRIVQESNSGLVCAPDEIDCLAGNARMLYQNINLAKKMAGNAHKYAEKTFDISTITDRFEKLLSKTLSNQV